VTQHAGTTRYEVQTSGTTVAGVVATFGGRTTTLGFEDGATHTVAEVPYGTDVTRLADTVKRHFPSVEFVSRRTRERSQSTVTTVRESTFEQLTDRQRVVLETAFAAGFFNWPRDTTGERLAETLDIAPTTFHKHVRAAERKLVTSLFT
jgi:predicted DNA binding protein